MQHENATPTDQPVNVPLTPVDAALVTNQVHQPEPVTIARLTAESIAHFSPEDQAEILSLADKIDPLQMDKILAFGSIPLLRTYDTAGELLQQIQGTSADQRVIEEVRKLSKEASKNQQELNLALEEPNFFEKLLLKISKHHAQGRAEGVSLKALTCYKLLTQLKLANDSWLETLQEGYELINASIMQDYGSACEIDKYVVAGLIAMKRLEEVLREKETKMLTSGLADDRMDYLAYQEGTDAFATVLGNLEKVRGAYQLSIGQLIATRKINKTLQIAIYSQKNHNLTVAAQQLRNATLDARHRDAAEGARSVTALNSALMQKVSSNIALTAEEATDLLRDGVFNVDAALTAAKTVIGVCTSIEKASQDARNGISQELDKLQTVMNELAPVVNGQRAQFIESTSSTVNSSGSSALSF